MKLLVLSWFDDKKQKVPHKSVLNFKKVPHKNVIYFVITLNFSIIRGKRMLGSIYLKQKYGWRYRVFCEPIALFCKCTYLTHKIRKHMRSKNTLEYLGLWEQLNNPNFKGAEFDPLLKEAGFRYILICKVIYKH